MERFIHLDLDKKNLNDSNSLSRESSMPILNMQNYVNFGKNLIDMGFSVKMINKIFTRLNPNSIEEAVELMSQVGGVWQHIFMEENGKCIICGGNDNHLNYLASGQIPLRESLNKKVDFLMESRGISITPIPTTRKSIISSFNEEKISLLNDSINSNIINHFCESGGNKKKIKIQKELKTNCKVCMENCSEFFSLCCNHSFCKICWEGYLHNEIFSANLSKINCMESNCNTVLEEEEIYEFINLCFPANKVMDIIDKYEYFKWSKEILNSNDKKFCPVVNCRSYGTRKRDENNVLKKFVVCEFGHEFCFDCKILRSEHKSNSCEDIFDENFEEWKKGKRVKQCPNCFLFTEKNEGCNHMTCTVCGFQWCWLCLSTYVADHYTNTNSSCYGRQFGSKIEDFNFF
jgi:hypothetical protein